MTSSAPSRNTPLFSPFEYLFLISTTEAEFQLFASLSLFIVFRNLNSACINILLHPTWNFGM
jgi:hypothetical protein